jgi:hypothetical protein
VNSGAQPSAGEQLNAVGEQVNFGEQSSASS